MKKIIFLSLMFATLISCDAVNRSRKVAGISRQKLFVANNLLHETKITKSVENSKDKFDLKVKEFNEPTIQPTLFWAHYDATQRGSMLYVDANQKVRVLAENPPDVAIQSIIGITAKVKGIEGVGEVEAAFNAQRSIAELGKRTAAVNMLRDALYRLNEMYYATVDENNETKKLLKENPKLMDVFLTDEKNLKSENLRNNLKSLNTLDNITLQTLFKNIIDNAKEIAINEASASIEIAKAESTAAVKASEEKLKKLELINALIAKLDGKLTKDELNAFIKDHIKN